MNRSPSNVFPIATWTIICLLAVAYTFETLCNPQTGSSGFFEVSANTVYELGASNSAALARGQYYRIFVSPFLHANLWHLMGNLLALSFVGALAERWISRCGFITILALGAFGGAYASCRFNSGHTISVGISGGVMALGAAVLFLVPPGADERHMRAKIAAWLVPGLVPLIQFGPDPVDFAAHATGAVIGITLGVVLLVVSRSAKGMTGALNLFRLTAAAVVFLLAMNVRTVEGLWADARKSSMELASARRLRSSHRFKEALESYSDLMRRNPTEPIYKVEYGDLLAHLGSHEEAITVLNRALYLDRSIAPAVFNIGVTVFNAGNHAAAARYFQLAADADATLSPAWDNLAISLASVGRPQDGLRALQEAAHKGNRDPNLIIRYKNYLQRSHLSAPGRAPRRADTDPDSLIGSF